VPGCSGFAATNGINVYDERAAELQDAGYLVVYVDYIGRRMLTNCAHVLQEEVAQDILDAAAWARGQAGIDASKAITYPNARHGFDMRGFSTDAPSGAPAYNPDAAQASWAIVKEFLR
jgi:dienelactone hydrolase